MPSLLLQPTKGALDQVSELVGRSVDGVVHRRGLMGDGGGWAAFKPSFHHATFFVPGGFGPVLVRDVNLHASDVRGEMLQGVFHHAADVGAESFAALDVVVGIDLDLHGRSGFGFGCWVCVGGRRRLKRGEHGAARLDGAETTLGAPFVGRAKVVRVLRDEGEATGLIRSW